jgi:sarcosine oxidase, subunit alpha
MEERNPAQWRFGRRRMHSGPGETLLSALLGKGLPLLQRSIRLHRPRAPYCGVGDCTQCLVRVNGVPNVRACRYVPSPGDTVRTENSWPSPSYDLLGILDSLFRNGVDTLHGFRRPSWAAPLFHSVVRRLAGYGRRPEPVGVPTVPRGRSRKTPFLVVGAGPAGRQAASRLRKEGADVLLLDRDPIGDPPEGVQALASHEALFLPPPAGPQARYALLAAAPDGAAVTIAAERVILAPGAYDTSLWFPGNDRPGVMTAEGAWRFSGERDRPPFRRAVVFGGGERAGMLLDRFGTQVEAVVSPGAIDPDLVHRATALDIPLYPRTMIVEGRGRRRISSVRLASRGSGGKFSVRADAILLAHRRYPNAQLFFQAGASMRWRGSAAAYYPELGPTMETSVPGLFAAGEAAGFPDGVAAEGSGIAAAEAALGREAPVDRLPGRVAAEGRSEMEGYYRELLAFLGPHPKVVACACEDVLLSEIQTAHARGYAGIEVIKRYTGVGTGLCQGRYCLPEALLVLSILEARPPPEIGYITQRPPVRPVALGTLAGMELASAAPEVA